MYIKINCASRGMDRQRNAWTLGLGAAKLAHSYAMRAALIIRNCFHSALDIRLFMLYIIISTAEQAALKEVSQ